MVVQKRGCGDCDNDCGGNDGDADDASSGNSDGADDYGGNILGSLNICVCKIPLNKIHYKIHFNNSSPCIFCFYIVHLSKLVPRLHCLHAAIFVTCDV